MVCPLWREGVVDVVLSVLKVVMKLWVLVRYGYVVEYLTSRHWDLSRKLYEFVLRSNDVQFPVR